jgi:hypothetical protein
MLRSMGKVPRLFKRWTSRWLFALAATALAVAPAGAEVLQARIAKLRTSAGSMAAVQLRLDWPRDADRGSMHLRAAQVDFPSLSWQGRDLDWQCPLLRTPQGRWRCEGPIRVKGGGTQRLALEFSADALEAELAAGRSRISFGREIAAGSVDARRVRLERVPVAWLKQFLAGMWQAGQWTSGSMDGWVDVAAPERGPLRVRTDLALSGVGVETPDGSLAASGVSGRLRLDYRSQGDEDSADVDFLASGGELLFQRFYAKLPQTKVQVQLLAQRKGKQPWRLPRLRWHDPGALEVEGEGTLDANAAPADLQLRLAMPNLALARDRYLSGFLAPAGFPDLVLSGGVTGTMRMAGGEPANLDAHLADVNAVDTKARFTLAGLAGEVRWNAGTEAQSSELRWNSGAIFGIGLGPARFAFTSSERELRLAHAAEVDALEGKLRLETLRWQAPQGDRGARFQFGLGVDKLDLASLSQRLGWPPFTGTISGRLPSARFEDDRLDIDGGLQMSVFGGSVSLTELAMERPFGSAPTLTGNVAIEDVDLEQITKVTGFGTITGRHDGRIRDLRLVNWSPVAFDARLETDHAWKGKKRLSQRAVKDISDVGGSGIAGGLQAKALAFFDDFGYDRIGLACKLRDNVCTMDGVGSAGDGYIIVAGAGLPRIQVVGFRRQVDWPTLVARLEAATQGQSPVIK